MTGFRFQDPWWLLLLIPTLVIGWYLLWPRRRTAVIYSNIDILKTLPRTAAMRIKKYLPVLWIVGLVLLILGMARPQRGLEEFRVKTEGIAIEMCLDRSGSMRALDFELEGERVDRLAAVKHVFRNFVNGDDNLTGRPNDKIGLVAFGGYADAKCPLTLDHGALTEAVSAVTHPQPLVQNGRIINEQLLQEESATAIGDAMALAIDRLKEADAKSKVIILLSDGEHNAGVTHPDEIAKVAKEMGIKVYTIGVGRTGVVPMPDLYGRIRNTPVRLDEAQLKKIAKTTGGEYFHADNTEALEGVYQEIDQLEKTKTEGRLYTQYKELYRYTWFLGLSLILCQSVLVSTRFRSMP